jgi:hypothetical protein
VTHELGIGFLSLRFYVLISTGNLKIIILLQGSDCISKWIDSSLGCF